MEQCFFQAQEVFPMNKCLNMPYFMNATTEFAYTDNNTPVMIGTFLEIVKKKTLSLESLEKLRLKTMSLKVIGNIIHHVVKK